MGLGIGLGLADFPFSGPDAFWRWVALAEDSGIDSLWQSDRLVGALPNLDAMSVMAALAGATRRIKFGMNVLSLGLREPVAVAKACATIDYLSNGRLLPAFGLGAPTSPDAAAIGQEPKHRAPRAREALQIITRLWRGETVDFVGAHYACHGAVIAPLPIQTPLPLWIGGAGPTATALAAEFGTGWQAAAQAPAALAPVIAQIKAAAVAAGRPLDPDHFGAGFQFRFGKADDAAVAARRAAYARQFPGRAFDDVAVVGDASDIAERLAAYQAAGARKFILRPIALGDGDVMEQTRRLAAEVLRA